jgi:hypothetical protein
MRKQLSNIRASNIRVPSDSWTPGDIFSTHIVCTQHSMNQYAEEETTLWLVHFPSTKIALTSFPTHQLNLHGFLWPNPNYLWPNSCATRIEILINEQLLFNTENTESTIALKINQIIPRWVTHHITGDYFVHVLELENNKITCIWHPKECSSLLHGIAEILWNILLKRTSYRHCLSE